MYIIDFREDEYLSVKREGVSLANEAKRKQPVIKRI